MCRPQPRGGPPQRRATGSFASRRVRPWRVVAKLLQDDLPAAGMLLEVCDFLFIGPIDLVEAASHHPQTGVARFGVQDELDQHRVLRPRTRPPLVEPAVGDAVGRTERFAAQLIGLARLETQAARPIGASLELRLLAEPLRDLVWLGHDAPYVFDGRVDQDLLHDLGGDGHGRNHTATGGCISVVTCATVRCISRVLEGRAPWSTRWFLTANGWLRDSSIWRTRRNSRRRATA